MNSGDDQQNTSTGGIPETLIITSVIMIVLLIIFLILRPRMARFFYPKYRENNPDSYRKLKKGCGWFRNVFGASDHEIMLSAGYNAIFQLKFIKYLMIYFLICTVIGIVILFPLTTIYAGGQSFPDLSASVYEEGYSWLWANFAVFAVFSIMAWLLIYYYQNKYFLPKLREAYRDPCTVQACTVYLDIPKTADPNAIFDYFNELYPDRVLSVHLGYHLPEHLQFVSNRKGAYVGYGKAEELLREKNKRIQAKECRDSSVKADALDHYTNSIDVWTNALQTKQLMPLTHKDSPVAFVTFREPCDAVRCIRDMDATTKRLRKHRGTEAEKTLKLKRWNAKIAPVPPAAVQWNYLYAPRWMQRLAAVGVNILVVLIALFWSAIVSFFSNIIIFGLTDAGAPYFGWILNISPIATNLIIYYIPILLVYLFLAFLPTLMRALTKLERPHSKTSLELGTLRKYFLFVVLNSLIFKTIFDSGVAFANQFLADPSSILNNFSSVDYSRIGAFLIGWLIFAMFLQGFVLLLLRPGQLISYMLDFARKSSKDTYYKDVVGYYSYMTHIAFCLLVFVITISFSVVTPLILPFGLTYFALRWFSDRYNFIYVHTRDIHSPGAFVPTKINIFFVSLLIFQVITFFFFLVKGLFAAAWASLALVGLSAILCIILAVQRKRNDRKLLKILDAARVPRHFDHETLRNAYLHPGLKPLDEIPNSPTGKRNIASDIVAA
eukprot:TRINITY_DN590_c0_g1_i1.p1 TRINITY_DN590_c0_g1~~TRINITY_DN590_c0_g1_i1.p1  ORF type:complete len:721 (-),score=200.87 TRINITY_DN590_c0_g1_i1:35-2197(-)